jgi:uncharacterized LabA/DUF88 family protein
VVDRVAVFVDYENVYWSAREAFHAGQPTSRRLGHINPEALGATLTAMGRSPRTLQSVRVYRGMPSPVLDPRGYRAWRAQIAQWEKAGVTVVSRVLRYPPGWPHAAPGEHPQEKGIDVALALDVVDLAHRGAYDVAIIVSVDSDLLPALEMIQRMEMGGQGPHVEVAAWSSPGRYPHRLRTPRRNVWCHWLDAAAYEQVRDGTDYSA